MYPIKRITTRAVCKKCNKEYIQILEEQPIGFKQLSYDDCPYCGNISRRSMSWDFVNSKIEEKDKDK